ncbi:MAG: PQQ-binding-like beta-propeller repeat protein [Planctomycetaceae bacterium]|nr:PQQ-binding-like beta-propeller repeat protein [Planctomycetaceae bacterium]
MTSWMIVVALFGADLSQTQQWPVFRGNGQSLTTAKDLPLNWSAEKNIAWKQDLKGYGQSSPVVWGERVFVTSADGKEKENLVIAAVNLTTGQPEWSKSFPASTKIPVSDYVSRSAPTPAVDADRVYAFFESGDLIALDHKGNEVWKRSLKSDYGAFEGNHGLGSSPALTKNAVVVLADHSGPSYLIGLDKKTGKTLWKTDRKPRVSWSSPIVVETPQGERIFLSSNGSVEAFNAKGEQIWEVTDVERNTVASPTVTEDFVVIGSSQVGNNFAIKRGGTGDVTGSHIAWRNREATSSFGSPLVHQGRVYFVNRSGGVVCADLKTGDTLWKERLPGSCWASPVGAGDRIYFFTKDGTTTVMASSDEKKTLAENPLPTTDRIYGVACLDGCILIRTGSQLLCIRESKS